MIVIDGVTIVTPQIASTYDGNFSEIKRFSDVEKLQVNISVLNGRAIKAWHIHKNQTDIFYPLQQLIVGVWDKRAVSPTYNRAQLFPLERQLIKIPPGCAHGVFNPSYEDRTLLYFVDNFYDGTDEGRIAWNALGEDFWIRPPE